MTWQPHMRLLLEVERERERELDDSEMSNARNEDYLPQNYNISWKLMVEGSNLLWRGPFSRTMSVFQGCRSLLQKASYKSRCRGNFLTVNDTVAKPKSCRTFAPPWNLRMLRMSPWWSHSPWGFGMFGQKMNPSKAYSLLEVKEVTKNGSNSSN